MGGSILSICLAALAACVASAAAGASDTGPPARCGDHGAIDASLFLVGDAGAPREPREPLLDALAGEAAVRSNALGAERVAIVLLGDNVYPAGLRPPDDPGRPEDERRLRAQLAAVQRSGARGFFVPGNHDWSNSGHDGWEAVLRQERFVADGGSRVMPGGGCAGPLPMPLGAHLELIFLDTQWWLHDGPRPSNASSGCAFTNEAEIEKALGAALRSAGDRHAIVLAHHPLRTGGPHGGNFGWKEHVFPLREIDRSLWIPIPVLGSVRHVARMLGVSPQETPSSTYQAMMTSVERGLSAAPPLVYAAGHDHGLQVIRGGGLPRFHVVSGGGSPQQITWAYPIEGTLFAAATPGYARLDSFEDGAVEIRIQEVGEDGAAREAFSACLSPARSAAPATLPRRPRRKIRATRHAPRRHRADRSGGRARPARHALA